MYPVYAFASHVSHFFFKIFQISRFVFKFFICWVFCFHVSEYAVKQNPSLGEDMQGGTDYIILRNLDIDGIRVIGRVLGQSIALDYFVSQVICFQKSP